MNKPQRQSLLLDLLSRAGRPVTGTELAETFEVSRQVIVKDIARLREKGVMILSTSSGYVMSAAFRERVIPCRHIGREGLFRELSIIVQNGGVALDVIIEHPIYGPLGKPLNLRSQRDVCAFTENLYASGSQPISALTDGIHGHTVRAADDRALDTIENALREAGIYYAGESE